MARKPLQIGPFRAIPGRSDRAFKVTRKTTLPNGRTVEAGDIIPRRQAENWRAVQRGYTSWADVQGKRDARAEAHAAGWKSYADFRRAQQTRAYKRLVQRARDVGALVPFENPETQPASDFNRMYLAARADGFDTAPGSPFHTMLTQYLGFGGEGGGKPKPEPQSPPVTRKKAA